MTGLEQLWAAHDEALDRLTVQQQRRLLAIVREHRRALLGEIALLPAGLTRRTLQGALVQINPLFARLSIRLGEALEQANVTAQTLSLDHAFALWRHRGLGALPTPEDTFRTIMAGRMADYRGLRLFQTSADTYANDVAGRIQQAITSGVLQNETEAQIASRIKQAAPLSDHRAKLVARMETNVAYNAVASEFVAEAGDGWTRRIVEYVDSRNHPFSRASDGVTAPPGRLFKVPVSDVAAAASAMGKSTSGILWRIAGDNYVGQNLPAHFGERGRVVPWQEESK